MATITHMAQVSLPTDREVKVVRRFNAPRALVYRAYTEPDLITRWLLGPPGWSMPVCEMDVRVGGAYRWRWRSNEGAQEFGFQGVFREVEANARLTYTQTYDPGDVGGDMGGGEAVIVVEFSEKDGVTTVATLMDFGSKETRDSAMSTGMTDGMEASYQLLEKLLAKQSA